MSSFLKMTSAVVLPLFLALAGAGCLAPSAGEDGTVQSENSAAAGDAERTGEAAQAGYGYTPPSYPSPSYPPVYTPPAYAPPPVYTPPVYTPPVYAPPVYGPPSYPPPSYGCTGYGCGH